MYCFEILDLPVFGLYVHGAQRLKSSLSYGINLGMSSKRLGSTAWVMAARIDDYSQRVLRNPSNILKGVLGIPKVFETGSWSLLWCPYIS